MKFLADESVEFQVLKSLRENDIDVVHISELSPGITDEEVIQIAKNQSRIIITGDKDFGTLTFRNRIFSQGIILFRLSGMTNQEKALRVISAIINHIDSLTGSFTVIGKELTRMRKLPK